jgi:tRNA (guanine10-N2)-dimethyltransferase
MRLIEVGGWHPHLPAAELSAVAGRSLFQVAKRVYVLPGDVDVARLAYSHRALAYIGGGRDLRPPSALYAKVTGSYAVRVHDPDRLLPHSARAQVIDEVWRSLPGRRVDLRDPAHEVNVYVTAGGLHWALLLDVPARGRLCERDPMQRPFFRSMLVPRRRARCLVNLTGVQPGQRFLDPFCGTGALLVEAALIGAEAYGSDIDPVMVGGSRENLRHEALPGYLRRIDARRLAEWGTTFDAIATDIPYGRSASTHGSDVGDLFQQLLVSTGDVLQAGAFAVVMAPAGLSLPEHHQFAVLARFRERASASLTRDIWLLHKAIGQRTEPVATARSRVLARSDGVRIRR